MLNEHYEKVKSRVAVYSNNVEFVALVSDGWSNIRGDSIINFVVTTPQPIFLKASNVTGDSHTGL
jgi:hypothetical protein